MSLQAGSATRTWTVDVGSSRHGEAFVQDFPSLESLVRPVRSLATQALLVLFSLERSLGFSYKLWFDSDRFPRRDNSMGSLNVRQAPFGLVCLRSVDQ